MRSIGGTASARQSWPAVSIQTTFKGRTTELDRPDSDIAEAAPAKSLKIDRAKRSSQVGPSGIRPRVAGKFLMVGDEKLWVRGVTYGTFRPQPDGLQFPSSDTVEKDFVTIAANKFNAVRVYTVPPGWLLDAAQHAGLWVMVGIPWEQHIAFLDASKTANDIAERVRSGVRVCAGHPAVLCYTVGNEIPASIVRWHGSRRVERFLGRLCTIVKDEDPGALVTYINYPTTEYLDLSGMDFLSFNVYLESRDALAAYLARLQNLAGERPLLMAEVGLDSRRNGEDRQSEVLAWQIRTIFAEACAGGFIFSWTDEWYRGGYDIEDWDFGLTTRERRPKPALAAVRQAFAEVPFARETAWPSISVVVCSYNGVRTIRDTLEHLGRLDYPDYEVIVVDDGSTDQTATIAQQCPVRLIRTENRGLSAARNTGLDTARGTFVAYIDDDAYPDPHWLTFLAHRFLTTDHAGVGGPNIAPPGDGPIADCVGNSPGGPVHVLLTDDLADHIPGCNMAFRRDRLMEIGGFDPRYRTAGDDVDVCWRLQQQGWTIGFHAGAVVWHHRRNSLRMYWRQQQGYGRAEALLEEKWPTRYNAAGHLAWTGRPYGKGLTESLVGWRWAVYHGSWGSALFQSVYRPSPGVLSSLPLMPEWYLVIAVLVVLCLAGLTWTPLLAVVLPLLLLAVGAALAQAVLGAWKAQFQTTPLSPASRRRLRVITAFMHLMQPLARLIGRLKHGLTPWRHRGHRGLDVPRRRRKAVWSEVWRTPEQVLTHVRDALAGVGAAVSVGGAYDRWDLEVRGGLFGSARALMAIEDHGTGQYVRFRLWPRWSCAGLCILMAITLLAIAAAFNGALLAAGMLGTAALAGMARVVYEAAAALETLASGVRAFGERATDG